MSEFGVINLEPDPTATIDALPTVTLALAVSD